MSGVDQARLQLAGELKRLLGLLLDSRLGDGDRDAALGELEAARPELERLKAELGPVEVKDVFRDYWRLERVRYVPLFDRGMDPEVLRDVLWRWLDTGEMATGEETAAVEPTGGPARPVPIPDLAGASYVYVETVRAVIADESDFAYTQQLAEQLIADRGYGFGGVVFDDRGTPVTPDWLAAASVSVAPGRRRLAVGAHLAHAALGLPAALDLGVRDERGLSWQDRAPLGLGPLPDKNLFLGDIDAGWLEMTEVGGSVCSIDTSPDGETLGLLEWWSGVAAVVTADARTGERRLLTTLEGVTGSEQIRFSADGAWLLVARFQQPCLVHVETGRWTALPTAGPVAWWPARSPGSLMLLADPQPGPAGVPLPQLIAYDLADGTGESFGLVELPLQADLDPWRGFPTQLEVSADGTQALCMTAYGPPGAFQEEHGSRSRVSLLDVEQRRVEVLAPPFAGTLELEREHHSARWLDRAAPASFAVPADLEAGLQEPENALGPENAGPVAADMRNVAVMSLQALIANPDGTPHRLRPEVLRSLAGLRRLAPGSMGELDEWVDSVCDSAASAIELPGCPPEIRDGWTKLIGGWERIKDPSLGPIPWESDRLLDAS